MTRSVIALAALCLAATPAAASAHTTDSDSLNILGVEVADYSAVDGNAAVQGATFGNWLGNLFGGHGGHGGWGGHGGHGGSSGGSTDVPAPPVLIIFGAAVAALGARSKLKQRDRA